MTATRIIEWDAGHRVYKHEGKCAHIHGHRYRAEITAAAELDEIGRVIDFSVLKAMIGEWIELHWDHGMLLGADDPLVKTWGELGHKHFVMPNNPTAENIAAYIGENLGDSLTKTGVKIVAVRVWETPNCYADWRLV